MGDPFEVLGVEARFDLDSKALEQRHRDLSKALHPDRYAGAPAAERRLALGRAVDVNEAFRALRDPIRRAEALLRRAGALAAEGAEPKASPALLMEMMEAREELAEARAKKDLGRVAKLGEAMAARQRAVLASLGRAFDAAAGDPEKSKAILPAVGELRYLRRFLDEVSAIEEDLAS
ncbi:MAG: Fe-S protein assembly co-chaperone HscB [Byssovorax sp.]